MKPPSVLLVDGDDCARHVNAKAFRRAGWRVSQARSAEAAWRMVARSSYTAFVTELCLAGHADGTEFTRALRCEVASAHAPVIVLSSQALDRDRQRAYEAGCTRFLPKPCLPVALVRVVSELVGDGDREETGPYLRGPAGTTVRIAAGSRRSFASWPSACA